MRKSVKQNGDNEARREDPWVGWIGYFGVLRNGKDHWKGKFCSSETSNSYCYENKSEYGIVGETGIGILKCAACQILFFVNHRLMGKL